MAQPLDPLRRADQPTGAAIDHLADLAFHRRLAFGACLWEFIGVARDLGRQVADDLRNDIAGALDDDTIARAHPEPLEKRLGTATKKNLVKIDESSATVAR